MANTIILKKSSVATKVPLAADLEIGELAVNLSDQKLYSKNAAGTVVLVGQGSSGSGTVTSVDVSGGTTGLTTSGGPITTSGTITLAGTLAIANGGTGFTTLAGASIATYAGTETLTNKTITSPTINNIRLGYTTRVTAGATTTLSSANSHQNFFTGTLDQTVQLPNVVLLVTGLSYSIENASTGTLTVTSSGGNTIGTIPAGLTALLTCISTSGTTAASWDLDYVGFASITGTGSAVLNTSPTLVTPNLGTPSSGTLTNCTFPTLNQSTTGSAATLTTGRTIEITGDLTYTSPSFNGSGNVTAAGTLAASGVTAGSYTNTNITVDAKGRVTAASNGSAGGVTSVTGTAPVVSSGGATPAISMAAASSGVNGYMTGAYATKLDGIATGATANTGTVTSITAGTGLSGGSITTSGTIALANTAVTAGAYTSANITVDAQGRITAAANGSGGTTIYDSFTATASQTTFTSSLSYTSGKIDVFANGVRMVNGADVTVTSGTNVVFASGLPVSTRVDLVYPR